LWEKTTYKDGVQDGPFESYHENGQVRDRGIYKGDKKCGEWVEGNETVTYNPC
jgi:antitoxin component YwqK of YwqJK toxin-antitoxin module